MQKWHMVHPCQPASIYSGKICCEYVAYKLAKECKVHPWGPRRFHGSIEWFLECVLHRLIGAINLQFIYKYSNSNRYIMDWFFQTIRQKWIRQKLLFMFIHLILIDILYLCARKGRFFLTPINISFHLEVTKIHQLTMGLLHWHWLGWILFATSGVHRNWVLFGHSRSGLRTMP